MKLTDYQAYLEKHLRFVGGQSGVEIKAHCPRPELHAHGDRNPSLSVNIEKGLLKCHVCQLEGNVFQVAKTMGWPSMNGNGASSEGLPDQWKGKNINSTYQYRNADGTTAFLVFRVEHTDKDGEKHKDFPVWCNGSWGLKGKGVEKVLYRLPEIQKAEWFAIAEGEKDVAALEKINIPATCNLGGVLKGRDEYNRYFKSEQKVVIFNDSDDVGREHALQVAQSIVAHVSSIKIIELPGPPKSDVSDWLKDRNDPKSARQELLEIIKSTPEWKPKISGPGAWTLYDISEIPTLEMTPQQWVIKNLIPETGIGWLSGAPKDGKSLLTLDLVIHIAHLKPWLDRFETAPARTLYVAREDPLRRIQERVVEINSGYGYGKFPTDAIKFLVRERFNLMDREHIKWIGQQVQNLGIDFLILDVLNRMIPELDEISAKDMGQMVSVLEELNRDYGLTILSLDHTRKPLGGHHSGRDRQAPNPFDLKGSVAKYGAADFMLCLSRTEQEGRLQLYCENKDTDERPHFFIDVSPKGSGEPKFTWAGDIDKLASDMKALGNANREKVHEALENSWLPPSDIASRTDLAPSTVRNHLKKLHKQGKAEKQGKGRETKWKKISAEVVEGDFGDNNGNHDE